MGLQKGFNTEGAVLTDRFYAGGGTTVRGFRQDELGPKLANGQPAGGNAVLVLNEELRYPLFWVFDAVTFVDIGNVFPRVSDFRLSDLRVGRRIRAAHSKPVRGAEIRLRVQVRPASGRNSGRFLLQHRAGVLTRGADHR